MLEILEPGPFTTVQDGGRYRLSHLGISPGGAADPLSLAIGNRLVGNPGEVAGLEMTLRGGRFRFPEGALVALTGSDFGALLGDRPVPPWRTLEVMPGERLTVGNSREGARAYLCVAGGLATPLVLGSRSALLGERLQAGDCLPLGPSPGRPKLLLSRHRFRWPTVWDIRVTRGADWESFDASLREVFLGSEFEMTPQSNRAGLRLKGPLPPGRGPGERLTEGVLWGTVQIPPSGQPLILMNDQQTTGGYPQLAQVIRADRPLLGQLKPGHRLRFRPVDFDEAISLLRRQAAEWESSLEPL